MPTRASACCSAWAVATSFGRSARKAIVVEKPFGWPHCCRAAFALSRSPVLSLPTG